MKTKRKTETEEKYSFMMILRCLKTGKEIPLCYIITQIQNVQHNSLDEDKIYEIVSFDGRVTTKIRKRKRRGKIPPPESPTVADYLRDCNRATQECLAILKSPPYNETNFNNNIFCPFHEIRGVSKTPSAKLFIDNHTLQCFSTRCKKRCKSTVLLQHLLSLVA